MVTRAVVQGGGVDLPIYGLAHSSTAEPRHSNRRSSDHAGLPVNSAFIVNYDTRLAERPVAISISVEDQYWVRKAMCVH